MNWGVKGGKKESPQSSKDQLQEELRMAGSTVAEAVLHASWCTTLDPAHRRQWQADASLLYMAGSGPARAVPWCEVFCHLFHYLRSDYTDKLLVYLFYFV